MNWNEYTWQPGFSVERLRQQQPPLPDVSPIFAAVKARGDAALRELTAKWDGVETKQLRVPPETIAQASVPSELAAAIETAYHNLYRFHAAQRPQEVVLETLPGILCGLRYVPLARVGLYVPGGTAPLFSTVLMLGIAAQLAGVPSVALASPPQPNGEIHPAILYAAHRCGITEIYQVGGAQAIAAFAYGTESIAPVHKIAGPGNRYVQAAKLEAARLGIAIDMPAGPSEVVVVADATARPDWVAADLLAQAEHGPDSLVGLITPYPKLIPQVSEAITSQVAHHPRRSAIESTLTHSWALHVPDMETAIAVADAVAPEHLILACESPQKWLNHLRKVGSVFLGHLTPESAGDYASGTNHVLPTGGTARSYGSLTVLSFMRSFTYQQLSPEGLRQLTSTVVTLAEAEGLPTHAYAMQVRHASL